MDFALFINSFSNIFQFNVMLAIFIGVAGGIAIGALPGLTGTMGVALLVPFTFGRPSAEGLGMLIGIFSGSMYGGSISAILINTPGTPSAAATSLDGYPLSKKGQAGRALSMSLFASFSGGIIGVIIMTFMSPIIAKAALEFGYVEYFALALFGLSIIISITNESMIKGLISGIFGLLIATIGMDPTSGYPRYTFGRMELLSGPSFIPVLIGLFAVAEVFNSIENLSTQQKLDTKIDRYLPSLTDIKRSTKNIIKSSIIGTAIGSIPGAGGDIAAFVAYGEAKRSSKHPELFGTGEIEAIAAPEAANNACMGGAMIPLLSLGVPGDAITAVLLGAFIMQGLQPGPLLYQEHIDVVYNVFSSMFIANIVMLILGIIGIRFFVKVITIKKEILFPIIFCLCIVGSFSMRQNIFDIWLSLIFGVIGYLMIRAKFPLSPILLALILGPMAESNLRRSLTVSQGDPSILLSRPIAIGLYIIALLSIISSVIKQKKIRKRLESQSQEKL